MRFVAVGEKYGRDNESINTMYPMVEFYDRRFGHDKWSGRGQFITRLPSWYFFIPQALSGMQLDPRVPAWALNHDDAKQVREYIETNGGGHACIL